ncbi:hypothetical protein EDD21DRAFT_421160 [Dissophora ornata]|nr:hypothetical protein BGZ58_002923 [Dissophora ornata]KAI8594939.1 hypothetical protein EDD21DRAFT_421160 [Dissophora ornata]
MFFLSKSDLQDENRKLVLLLSDETAATKKTANSSTQRTAQMIRIEEQLKNFTVKYNVVSNVLQGLLLESGVDWVNDAHYLDLMLKLKRTAE